MPRQPGEQGTERRDDRPGTDLPPTKEPYYEGYFGTEEEEGVVREEEPGDGAPARDASDDHDWAGGDREI
jgi:hypothetical protein